MRSRRLSIVSLAVMAFAVTGCSAGADAPGTDSSGTPSAGAGLTLEQVKDRGSLVVGTEGTYRPFSYHEGGSGPLTGYDVDVVTAVADKLGVTVTFEETQWDALFAALDSGRIDVIANQVSINPEREAKYTMSEPYTISPGALIVAKDNTDISSFDDLKGKTSAQSLTSNWYSVAEGYGANIESVEGWAQAVELLRQGRVDATVNDKLTYLDYAQTQKGDTGLKIVAETDDPSRNALAFRGGSEDLADAANTALDELRADGTLAKLSEKYFGEDVSE